jgi:hypothetical protein
MECPAIHNEKAIDVLSCPVELLDDSCASILPTDDCIDIDTTTSMRYERSIPMLDTRILLDPCPNL